MHTFYIKREHILFPIDWVRTIARDVYVSDYIYKVLWVCSVKYKLSLVYLDLLEEACVFSCIAVLQLHLGKNLWEICGLCDRDVHSICYWSSTVLNIRKTQYQRTNSTPLNLFQHRFDCYSKYHSPQKYILTKLALVDID